jgi:alpha-beta hydrolase superfamily lysophospholipase
VLLLLRLLLLQEDHQLWVDDLLSFTRSLQDSSSSSSSGLQAFAGLPTYLLASSLGGNLAVHAALREVGRQTK